MTGAADWTGRVGNAWADEWRRTERAFREVAVALDAAVARVAPSGGTAVDIGCGAGSTGLALAARDDALSITGVDLSAPLLAVARERAAAAGVDDRLRFRRGDAEMVVPALPPVDLFVSRHGVMFFDDPVRAFATLAASARPGAPLVFSTFSARGENDWAAAVDQLVGTPPAVSGHAPGPFAFADRALVTGLLARSGWRAATAERIEIPYVVGAGPDPVGDALAFYRRIGPVASLLAASDAARRADVEARLGDLFASRIFGGAVTFTAAINIYAAQAGEGSA